MPISGIPQPELISVEPGLRLRKFDGVYDFALDWYQDIETVYLVDGVSTPYTEEKLARMYTYLNNHGELYFIEAEENSVWRPIGDVTFSQEDLPIVIGDRSCRGKQIGQKVIQALIRRGKELGYSSLQVREIYEYNTASRRCFESAGFRPVGKTENGSRYLLTL